MLAEGNQIFYDKPEKTKNLFKIFSIELQLYKNPADQLLKIANNKDNLEKMKRLMLEKEIAESPFRPHESSMPDI